MSDWVRRCKTCGDGPLPLGAEECVECALAPLPARGDWDRLEPARALAAWLVEFRSDRRLTQAQLADGLGWPAELVEEVENAEGLAAPSSVREGGDGPRGRELVEYVAQGLFERFTYSSWPRQAIAPSWTEETHPRQEGWRGLARLVLPPELLREEAS